jgi:hypothetical protein
MKLRRNMAKRVFCLPQCEGKPPAFEEICEQKADLRKYFIRGKGESLPLPEQCIFHGWQKGKPVRT